MSRYALLLVSAASVVCQGGVALAETCRIPPTSAKTAAARSRECTPAARVEPYDPDRVKVGRNPGFIDLGNGTEVRVGGRVRMDYDARR